MPAAVEALRAVRGLTGRIWRLSVGDPVGLTYKKNLCRALGEVDFPKLRQPRWTSHALRYLAAKQLRQQNVAPEVAAAILGHTVAVMMKTYRKVDSVEIDLAMARAQLGLPMPAPEVPVLRVVR